MRNLEELLNAAILDAGDHAGRAVLLLDRFRHSPDPEMAMAYRLVHDLMGDLGAIRLCAHMVIAAEVGPDAAAPLRSTVRTCRVAAPADGP